MYSSIKYQVWNSGNIVHFNLNLSGYNRQKNRVKLEKNSTSSNSIFQKSCMSTIDVSPGVSGVSKNQGGLTEYDFDSLKC